MLSIAHLLFCLQSQVVDHPLVTDRYTDAQKVAMNAHEPLLIREYGIIEL